MGRVRNQPAVMAKLQVKGQLICFTSIIELQEIVEFSKKTLHLQMVLFTPGTFLPFLIPFFPREHGLEHGELTDRLHP